MPRDHMHVLIAGGGVAGLEALLALRVLSGRRARITLVTDASQTIDRPITVAAPFDRGVPTTRDVAAIAADQGAELYFDRLVIVEPERSTVVLASGRRLVYDALVVATGAGAAEALPGALTFRGAQDVRAVRALRDDAASGAVGSIAFALTARSTWPVPLYELASMLGADLRASRVHAEVTIVTPEPAPLAVFGPRAAEALEPLLRERGVRVRAGVLPVAVEPGRLVLADGNEIAADRVVTLAVPRARPIAGLPVDHAGFVPVDAHGRVPGLPGVYAAGDVTAFPLKQGGLAAQQADAAAETIAAELGAPVTPKPFRAILRGLLLIGGAPLYLRAEAGTGEAVAERAAPLSAASTQALWWPPAKVAARYLGPYLATARPARLGEHPLVDRPEPATSLSTHEHEEARQLAMALADAEARWGDFDAALCALEAARALDGTLSAEDERKRERWAAAR